MKHCGIHFMQLWLLNQWAGLDIESYPVSPPLGRKVLKPFALFMLTSREKYSSNILEMLSSFLKVQKRQPWIFVEGTERSVGLSSSYIPSEGTGTVPTVTLGTGNSLPCTDEDSRVQPANIHTPIEPIFLLYTRPSLVLVWKQRDETFSTRGPELHEVSVLSLYKQCRKNNNNNKKPSHKWSQPERQKEVLRSKHQGWNSSGSRPPHLHQKCTEVTTIPFCSVVFRHQKFRSVMCRKAFPTPKSRG